MEEYENLKRLPDQRQLYLERIQNQQRLNAMITQQLQQQQQMAAQSRFTNTNVAGLINEFQQTFRSLNGAPVNYNHLLQLVNQRVANMGTATAINDRTNNVVKTATKRVQKALSKTKTS